MRCRAALSTTASAVRALASAAAAELVMPVAPSQSAAVESLFHECLDGGGDGPGLRGRVADDHVVVGEVELAGSGDREAVGRHRLVPAGRDREVAGDGQRAEALRRVERHAGARGDRDVERRIARAGVGDERDRAGRDDELVVHVIEPRARRRRQPAGGRSMLFITGSSDI